MFNVKEYKKQYRTINRDKIKEYHKQWRNKNRHKIIKYAEQSQINNAEYYKKYREIHKKEINEYKKNRYKTNIKFNLSRKIGIAINIALNGNKKGRHWEILVGYSLTDLIKHLKKTIPKGYIWKDYLNGKLHIDHILPIKLFKYKIPEDKEFKQCWSLYNLRLLLKEENFLKGDTINNPILLGLLLKDVI